MSERMYTGETPDEFHARRAPLENFWNGFMGAAFASVSIMARSQFEASARMEQLLGHAAAMSVPAAKVHEIVAAERHRAESSPAPFSWETVRDKVDGLSHEAPRG